MDPNLKLLPDQRELLEDQRRYSRLVGKLHNLTMAQPDIAYSGSVVSQFISAYERVIGMLWSKYYDI